MFVLQQVSFALFRCRTEPAAFVCVCVCLLLVSQIRTLSITRALHRPQPLQHAACLPTSITLADVPRVPKSGFVPSAACGCVRARLLDAFVRAFVVCRRQKLLCAEPVRTSRVAERCCYIPHVEDGAN